VRGQNDAIDPEPTWTGFIYERRDDAKRGGSVSYAPNVHEQYRATATYVARILGGENPGDPANNQRNLI